jgi:hypothetical protein
MSNKPTRAMQLIDRLLRDGAYDQETLARELVIRPKTLAEYQAGTTPMPLDRQLCLALVAIEKAPAHARDGYRLREQVRAATGYEQRMLSPNDGALVQPRRF